MKLLFEILVQHVPRCVLRPQNFLLPAPKDWEWQLKDVVVGNVGIGIGINAKTMLDLLFVFQESNWFCRCPLLTFVVEQTLYLQDCVWHQHLNPAQTTSVALHVLAWFYVTRRYFC